MIAWTKISDRGAYAAYGYRVRGLVSLDGEIWFGRVYVDNELVDLSEWEGRDVAFRNTKHGMKRACEVRRFDKDPPVMPEEDETKEDE